MIKVIVFDFDDTLYIGKVWKNFKAYLTDILTKYFSSKEKGEQFLKRAYEIDKNLSNKNNVKLLEEEGYDSKKYVELIEGNIYEHACVPKFISHKFLEDLTKKYPVYIVSMSSPNYMKRYLKKYGFDDIDFKNVYSVDLLSKNKSKKDNYEKIAKDEKIKPDELLVVGDDYINDIVPAIEAGVKYIHIGESFNQIYDYFTENNILDCEKYKKIKK